MQNVAHHNGIPQDKCILFSHLRTLEAFFMEYQGRKKKENEP